MKLKNNCIRICAALILAASALHHPAAHAATTAAPDSKADISVYRLGDGGVTPVARYSDVEITNWEEVCWGEGNALYVRGSYYNDEEDGPPDERAVDKCLKFTLPS